MARRPFSFRGVAARLGFALALAAVGGVVLAAPLLAAGGYLVSDAKRECYPLSRPPGVGLGGLRWAEECPEGYEVKPLPQPEKPWYVKLLDVLDRWFGLKDRVLWVPSAGQVALVTSLVLLLRRLAQLFQVPIIDQVTHGWGTVVISALVSFLTVVQPLVEDGSLTWYELGLALGATMGAAAAFWEVIKGLVGPSAASDRLGRALRSLLGRPS